ncbi:MAG: hypothetical protein WA118_08130 [Carboxydocellales bacterium]
MLRVIAYSATNKTVLLNEVNKGHKEHPKAIRQIHFTHAGGDGWDMFTAWVLVEVGENDESPFANSPAEVFLG